MPKPLPVMRIVCRRVGEIGLTEEMIGGVWFGIEDEVGGDSVPVETTVVSYDAMPLGVMITTRIGSPGLMFHTP
jgi:hypothetical protein